MRLPHRRLFHDCELPETMTYPAENPFDEVVPGDDDMTSEDAYARGASADGDEEDIEDAPPGGRAAASAVDDLQRALDEQRDRYLRLAAEYDNFRKRTQKERAESGARAQAELVKQLIDSLDDLSRFATIDPAATDGRSEEHKSELQSPC